MVNIMYENGFTNRTFDLLWDKVRNNFDTY